MTPPTTPSPERRLRERFATHLALVRIIPAMALLGVALGAMWVMLAAPPTDFSAPRLVRIEEGMGLRGAAAQLKEEGIIRKADVFLAAALIFAGERSLIAGEYYFSGPQNAFVIASRLTQGDYELYPVKVTLPEGATAREMARILADKLVYFDAQAFLALAEGKEGYLFPDTYHFLPTASAETIVRALENNFYRRTESFEAQLAASGHTLHEIVTMASLLEEEASKHDVRRMISGILWHRIDIGMKLQVDAVFPYIIGKNTFEVTMDDLMVDSPYNTYLYKGLPLGPISNPGLSSIEAALNPTPSNYLFYLADMRGITHYSKTYAEHMRKVRLYLGS